MKLVSEMVEELEERLQDVTHKLEFILARTVTEDGYYTFDDGDTWPASSVIRGENGKA